MPKLLALESPKVRETIVQNPQGESIDDEECLSQRTWRMLYRGTVIRQ